LEPTGHGSDQVARKRCGGHFPGLLVQFNESELGRTVDGNEEIQLAFGHLNPSNLNADQAIGAPWVQAQGRGPNGWALHFFFEALSPSTSGRRLISCH
jgi:hypothetical protein